MTSSNLQMMLTDLRITFYLPWTTKSVLNAIWIAIMCPYLHEYWHDTQSYSLNTEMFKKILVYKPLLSISLIYQISDCERSIQALVITNDTKVDPKLLLLADFKGYSYMESLQNYCTSYSCLSTYPVKVKWYLTKSA